MTFRRNPNGRASSRPAPAARDSARQVACYLKFVSGAFGPADGRRPQRGTSEDARPKAAPLGKPIRIW